MPRPTETLIGSDFVSAYESAYSGGDQGLKAAISGAHIVMLWNIVPHELCSSVQHSLLSMRLWAGKCQAGVKRIEDMVKERLPRFDTATMGAQEADEGGPLGPAEIVLRHPAPRGWERRTITVGAPRRQPTSAENIGCLNLKLASLSI